MNDWLENNTDPAYCMSCNKPDIVNGSPRRINKDTEMKYTEPSGSFFVG